MKYQYKLPITLSFLIVIFLIPGCAATDKVIFVTKSSIGIDFDTKPPVASVGYDRIEGYLGPRYSNGAIPPVIAEIKTDGKIFNPRIRQIYASGDAAVVIGGGSSPDNSADLAGDKALMFFGTTTTTGLKVGFTNNVPDSFTFGYKRKEFSIIPLAHDGNKDIYPSVLATIDTGANVAAPAQTGLNTGQFFATGAAAVALAPNIDLAQLLERGNVAEAMVVYDDQDPNVDKIGNWLKSNHPANRDALRKWMDCNNLKGVGVTSFYMGSIYKAQRAAAVRDLNIN